MIILLNGPLGIGKKTLADALARRKYMEHKIKINKGTIQETLLLPLWGRAYETQKSKPRIVDKNAVEIIKRIDYDFSNIEGTQSMSQHGWVARSLHTDRMARSDSRRKYISNKNSWLEIAPLTPKLYATVVLEC